MPILPMTVKPITAAPKRAIPVQGCWKNQGRAAEDLICSSSISSSSGSSNCCSSSDMMVKMGPEEGTEARDGGEKEKNPKKERTQSIKVSVSPHLSRRAYGSGSHFFQSVLGPNIVQTFDSCATLVVSIYASHKQDPTHVQVRKKTLIDVIKRHRWSDVFQASWKKYPNPRRPDILHVDVINKEFDPEKGTLTTTRIVFSKGPIPLWLRPVFGQAVAVFVEEAVMDPKNKTMKMLGVNHTFDSIVKTEELCTYTPNEENEEWTDFTQQAKVTSFASYGASKVEDFILKQFKENASKGREIMEMAIQRVEQEHLAFAAAAHAAFL